ncbi:AAA domain-containing protein [Sinomonas gamaensis]|uniref:AAA domain-containing protein n=1 Tax=Sinomonas gamaensis TaxID=2565624 RepID=UPI00110838F0|nr:AAA domain-containing protein [Sinomonas gamaensis]
MLDPKAEAVLIKSSEQGYWEDKTSEIASYRVDADATLVRFIRGSKTYRYRTGRIQTLRRPEMIQLTDDVWVEIRGRRSSGAVAACRFSGPAGARIRVFSAGGAGVRHELHPECDVRIVRGATSSPRAAQVLAYWRQIVGAMPAGRDGPNPLKRAYEQLTHVHPDSVLGRYLNGRPIGEGEGLDVVPIFPFSSNVSQRAAVKNALRFPISVIEGPPGTGKTQTILNLIATLIATPRVNVGVVSFNNAAVDNVLEKLTAQGFGHVVANLGNRDKKRRVLSRPGCPELRR